MIDIEGELPAHSVTWLRVRTIDAHAAGEPLRVIVGGLEPIPGADMPAKRRWAQQRLEHLRRARMWEPRGHGVIALATVAGECGWPAARGELAPGEELEIAGQLGGRFGVRELRETAVGARAAVVPRVRGSAHLTGRHEFRIDPEDPSGRGFLLR